MFFTSLASEDLSLARLAEGHADALAILVEADQDAPYSGVSYGGGQSRTGSQRVTATPVPGGWRLSGEKPFCSGSGVIDRALVTAEAPDGYRLFDVEVDEVVIDKVPESWPAVGMADSVSETLCFGGTVVSERHAVGQPGFYTERPGFWFGACGVASCWYGGALGLMRAVLASVGAEPGELALSKLAGRGVTYKR